MQAGLSDELQETKTDQMQAVNKATEKCNRLNKKEVWEADVFYTSAQVF